MKYLNKAFFIIVCCVLMCGTKVFAAESLKVMGVDEQGNNPVFYIKGASEINDIQVVIGNVEATGADIVKISEKEISMKTFVLIDNSLSIPEKNRNVIKDIISELIAGRENNEQFAIATFGEEIEILTEFTSDYIGLKNIINNIEFQDRETYLTDILYDLIKEEFLKGGNDCYTRIFVISDGVDNKSLGYTTEELSELLTEYTIPVYALGVYNKKGSNEEELKKLFALSRQTNAEFFLLDEIENNMMIISELAKDHEIIAVEVFPNSTSKDGSEKTIQLEFMSDGEKISLQVDRVRMPQEKLQHETYVQEEMVLEEKGTEVNTNVGNNSRRIVICVLIIVSIIVAITLIIFGARFMKKKQQEKEIKVISDPFVNDGTEISQTELVGIYPKKEGDGTILLFDGMKKVKITLTDLNTPARSFSTYIDKRIVIGRSASSTDVCIDYDQSVSGKHCAIEMRNDRCYLIDLQSSNKTYLNENLVLSEVEISSGSILKMGRVRMRVEMS